MAIHPGDARLPLYRDGVATAVFRKLSPAKSVGLYLAHRTIWCDAFEVYKRKKEHGTVRLTPNECGGTDEDWTPGYKPEHHGKVEGIVHVNPWLINFGWYVYVEVEASYNYFNSSLDRFDFEVREVIYKDKKLLNPPSCYKEGRFCMRAPPPNIDTYSAELRLLYEKLGGPIGSLSMRDEMLTSSGVVVGAANMSRKNNTIIPPTKAAGLTSQPDHPYVTYNFPFRFDISAGPDSIYLKTISTLNSSNQPKSRQKIFYESVFGFNYEEIDSDPESPSESEDEAFYHPGIRHPGEPKKHLKPPSTAKDTRRQWEKDLFHPDSYPWRPRPKKAPKNGITWAVRVYAVETPSATQLTKHRIDLKIRKLTFLPKIISLHWRQPKSVYTDYCLAVGPRAGTDAGVITLVGKLDKYIYTPGEQIEVNIKVHNHSVRLIQTITIYVSQCIRSTFWNNRVWRSPICQRVLCPENLRTGLPIMPGSMNCRYRVLLNPWTKMLSANLPTQNIQSAKNNAEERLNTLRFQGYQYALEPSPRHNTVPPKHNQRLPMATTNLPHLISKIMDYHPPPSLADSELPGGNTCIDWSGDPHRHCRCFHRRGVTAEQQRNSHFLPKQPYQFPVDLDQRFEEADDIDGEIAARNELAPICFECGSGLSSMDRSCPLSVTYEVTITCDLLDQTKPDPLATDHLLLNSTTLGSGLLIDPAGVILGKEGPRISLNCFLARHEPGISNPVPVANYNVDQRQNQLDNEPPKLWEPSLGKGFFVKRGLPAADCKVP